MLVSIFLIYDYICDNMLQLVLFDSWTFGPYFEFVLIFLWNLWFGLEIVSLDF